MTLLLLNVELGFAFTKAIVIHNDIFDSPRQTSDLFFVGGIQIDRFGNTNLIGLSDGGRPVRPAGSGPARYGAVRPQRRGPRMSVRDYRKF